MPQYVNTPVWEPILDDTKYVCVTQCDFAVDTVWVISSKGTTDYAEKAIVGNWITVDNLANNGTVALVMGPLTPLIPPYTRQTFRLPLTYDRVQISGAVGIVTAYISEIPTGLPDLINQSSIAGGTTPGTTVYTHQTITVTQPQSAADGNKFIDFVGVGAITYDLLPTATATNGFYSPQLWNNGAAAVSIVPALGETINGIWTNALPLILQPGDSIQLSCDGAQWFAHGSFSFETVGTPIAPGNVTVSLAHTMGVVPKNVQAILVNIVGEFGYNPGDELPVNFTSAQGTTGLTRGVLSVSSTSFDFVMQSAAWNIARRSAPGTISTMTNGFWEIIVRANHPF